MLLKRLGKMKTILYDRHLELGAKIVDFAGWQMPIHYTSVIKEHLAVRNAVGLFDVSHMGIIDVTGIDAGAFLDHLSTNQILGKGKHTAIYTVLPLETGGTVDDVIVYCEDEQHYFVVVNASNREKSLNHLKKHAAGFKVKIQDRFLEDGILAIQGPNALKLISPLFLEAKNLKKMHFMQVLYHGQKIILSRTGYTGELGFEIYAKNALILELFDWLLNEGKPFGILPIGLGARDTLRLEKGYSLYGHELSESIMASMSLSAWTIKWQRDFIGKQAMVLPHQQQYGVIIEKGIARENYDVYKNGHIIGHVTSGNYSPILQKAIAVILVDDKLNINDTVEIKIRDQLVLAVVKKLPFISEKK